VFQTAKPINFKKKKINITSNKMNKILRTFEHIRLPEVRTLVASANAKGES
jgi:hypothetical protein